MTQLRTYQREVARLVSVDVEKTNLVPVSISDAKLYARVDHNDEDVIFGILVDSARADFESYTGKLLFQRTVTAVFDCDDDSVMILPYLPVVEITSVQEDGDDVDYELKGDRININTTGEIEVVYECGLSETQVDNEVKLGALKYVVSNYEDRQDVAAMGITQMPNGSKQHWNKYKNFSL